MHSTKDLVEIYNILKNLLSKYSKYFNDIRELPGRYSLWNKKDLLIDGRKRDEVYFTGLIIQSNYVGFYSMSVYILPDLINKIDPRLAKLLKGKSCFHIKELDDELLFDIENLIKLGLTLYKKNNWI